MVSSLRWAHEAQNWINVDWMIGQWINKWMFMKLGIDRLQLTINYK